MTSRVTHFLLSSHVSIFIFSNTLGATSSLRSNSFCSSSAIFSCSESGSGSRSALTSSSSFPFPFRSAILPCALRISSPRSVVVVVSEDVLVWIVVVVSFEELPSLLPSSFSLLHFHFQHSDKCDLKIVNHKRRAKERRKKEKIWVSRELIFILFLLMQYFHKTHNWQGSLILTYFSFSFSFPSYLHLHSLPRKKHLGKPWIEHGSAEPQSTILTIIPLTLWLTWTIIPFLWHSLSYPSFKRFTPFHPLTTKVSRTTSAASLFLVP
jgi:hypothetical protein